MIDRAQIIYRSFPACMVAGAILIVVCATAIAKDKPITDRVDMFGAPRSGVIAKAKELPNVDDRDVVVLSRTYVGIPQDEVNAIDELCEECVPAKASVADREMLARMLVSFLFCAFGAGIVHLLTGFPVRRVAARGLRIRNGAQTYRNDPDAQRVLFKTYENL